MKILRHGFLLSIALGICSISQANLLTNGGFEAGNFGFSSDYTYSPTDYTPAAIYSVDTNPNTHHGSWSSFGDHTTGTGNMLIVNGSTSSANDRAWYQEVSLTAGMEYTFSGWGRSQFSSSESLFVTLDNVEIATNDFVVQKDAWTFYTFDFTATSTGLATIAIEDRSSSFSGNDYSLDDLSLEAVPEPGTMALLGLGALAALRRKKRSV